MSGTTTGKKRSRTAHLEKFSSKRVAKIFKPSWETYYFQLVGGAYLQYFHKGTATKPHKQVYLTEITRLELLNNWSERPFCFRVYFSDTGRHKAGEMMWTLAARTNEERIDWMEAIRPGSSAPEQTPQRRTSGSDIISPPPRPHSMMGQPSLAQQHQHTALAQRRSMDMVTEPPSYDAMPAYYPPLPSPVPPKQVEQAEGPTPPLNTHEHGMGNGLGMDNSLVQSHYTFAVPGEMGVGLGPSSLPAPVESGARSSNLQPPEGSTGQRPLSPGGYHVMNSPSEEEMHSIRENLKVMRTQSLKFHRTEQPDSGSNSPGRHYSVPRTVPAPQSHTDSNLRDAATVPSSHREKMNVSFLDSHPTAESEPQLEPTGGVPTGSDHQYSVLEEESSYELPTPMEVRKGMAFLELAEEKEEGPLSLLNAADEAEFCKTFSNALVSHCDITVGREIGEGAFGRVYHGYMGAQKQEVAIKTIRNCDSKSELINFLKESALMKDFDHPHVLGLSGVCLDKPTREPLILLPYMANGDLKSYITSKRGDSEDASTFPEGLDEQRLLVMCEQIASGMAYLENRHFVHRDLAARNCMMDGDMRVKIADFGMARDMNSSEYYRLSHKARLPVKWMAPESFYDAKFSSKTDVWSFGVTCWEVFSLGRSPYPGVEPFDILTFLDSGRRMNKPSLCPDAFYRLLLSCWDKSSSSRPSFSALVSKIQNILEGSNYINVSVHQH